MRHSLVDHTGRPIPQRAAGFHAERAATQDANPSGGAEATGQTADPSSEFMPVSPLGDCEQIVYDSSQWSDSMKFLFLARSRR